MSITISSNQAASYTALHMKRANSNLTKSLQRLSSGKRIISPADDAGGLAVGMKLQSSLKRAAASRMNTQNGTSFLQMQDSVMKVAGEILDRMSELKSFFNDVSKGPDDRETYNHEFTELQKELNSLKSQKFNGVSLFATREPDNNPLKIITSDDGLGEHIELKRTGFFENLKSKYGADGELNTGSSGSYRQLVGSFTADGGLTDANPGFASRDYSEGAVVFKAGGLADDSGYFMALTSVKAGVKIEDTSSPTSQWIRIADSQGNGFAEAYSDASEFNPDSIKYTSAGNQVAYLKGDIIKVPAHWASPGSNLFIRAEADVPRGFTLTDIFSDDGNGNPTHIGTGKYFSYVGEDSLDGAKPTTEYIRANINLPEPSFFGGSAAQLTNTITSNAANGYAPSYVKSTDGEIYSPAFDWGLKQWNPLNVFNYGDAVFDEGNDKVLHMHSTVKGAWGAAQYSNGDYVLHGGKWHQVTAATGASSTQKPHNPDTTAAFNNINGYSEGQAVLGDNNQVKVATAIMKGDFNPRADYANGDVVHQGNQFFELDTATAAALSSNWSQGAYGENRIVRHNGEYYFRATGAGPSDVTDGNPAGGNGWTKIGSSLAAVETQDSSAALQDINGNAIALDGATTTTAVTASSTGLATTGTLQKYFSTSPFQAYSSGDGTTVIGDPTANRDGAGAANGNTGTIDRTDEYREVANTKYWTKSHFGALDGITVNASYQYGDNIHYQGKNYVYTSHLSSENFLYLKGADPSTGYTEFENLLELGAVRELPMYVDTIGGGGNGSLPEGVYFKPNQDLEYAERISDSGMVRTSGAERRTDAPNPPGDDIYASADDQFYGGLNAGNDGIYGTADDFYATTVDPNIARNGGQIDADADNNKDLLDENLDLQDFSVADFVDYIQNLANVRAVNGGTMSRLGYAQRILEENEINLGAAASRIMDADMAYESTKMASHNVLLQAAASMVTQANSLNSVVLSLLQ